MNQSNITEDKNFLVKSAATYGVYLGTALLILAIIEHLTGDSTLLVLLNYFIFVGGIMRCTIIYRDKILEGNIRYLHALRFSTLLCFFSAIIMGAYAAFLYTVISPESFEEGVRITSQQLLENGTYNESELTKALELVREMGTPINLFIASTVSYTTLGLFVSLFTSFFAQKLR
ncbi:MAG: DUF4199 domain-containing protein [Bacteroidales bacterium]